METLFLVPKQRKFLIRFWSSLTDVSFFLITGDSKNKQKKNTATGTNVCFAWSCVQSCTVYDQRVACKLNQSISAFISAIAGAHTNKRHSYWESFSFELLLLFVVPKIMFDFKIHFYSRMNVLEHWLNQSKWEPWTRMHFYQRVTRARTSITEIRKHYTTKKAKQQQQHQYCYRFIYGTPSKDRTH